MESGFLALQIQAMFQGVIFNENEPIHITDVKSEMSIATMEWCWNRYLSMSFQGCDRRCSGSRWRYLLAGASNANCRNEFVNMVSISIHQPYFLWTLFQKVAFAKFTVWEKMYLHNIMAVLVNNRQTQPCLAYSKKIICLNRVSLPYESLYCALGLA